MHPQGENLPSRPDGCSHSGVTLIESTSSDESSAKCRQTWTGSEGNLDRQDHAHLPRRRRAHRILLAEISNWTGKVLVAPRSQLDQLSKREEVRRTGVYLLVGPDPDDPSRALASIVEGDNVLKRLLRQNKNEARSFWEHIVVHSRPLSRAGQSRDVGRTWN